MNYFKASLYFLAVLFFVGVVGCSKDDDTDPDNTGGGGNPGEEVENVMSALVNGSDFNPDTLLVSNTGRALNFQGKPYNLFRPSITVVVDPNREAGVHPFAVSGRVETANYVDANGNVFIAESGEVEILEHRIGEYIKATFKFTGVAAAGGLPDVEITGGEFEAEY